MKINKISKFISIFPFFFYTSIVLSEDLSIKSADERIRQDALNIGCDPRDKTDIFCQVMLAPIPGMTKEINDSLNKIQDRMDATRPEMQRELSLESKAAKERYQRKKIAARRTSSENQKNMKPVSEKNSQKIVDTMKNVHEYRKNPKVFVVKKTVKGAKKIYSSVKKRTKI